MWTLISGINFRAAKRRLARPVVAATVVLGTFTHVALALLPQPVAASPEATDSRTIGTLQWDQTSAGACDCARDTA